MLDFCSNSTIPRRLAVLLGLLLLVVAVQIISESTFYYYSVVIKNEHKYSFGQNNNRTTGVFDWNVNIVKPGVTGLVAHTTWKSYSKLRWVLSREVYDETMVLMQMFQQLCAKHNITFIMADGTLLGSYFFHDIIPWDDDLDVMVKFTDRDKLLKGFMSKEFMESYDVTSFQSGTDWYNERHLTGQSNVTFHPIPSDRNTYIRNRKNTDLKCKIFKKSSPKAGKYRWRYPFIDIKFYQENETDLWKMDNMNPQKYRIFQSDFYPLHLRPFGKMWLPAPKETMLFLKKKFNVFKCKSGKWDHIKEKHKARHSVSNCAKILDYYPHVDRTSYKNGTRGVVESLVFNNKVIHTALVDEDYRYTDTFSFRPKKNNV